MSFLLRDDNNSSISKSHCYNVRIHPSQSSVSRNDLRLCRTLWEDYLLESNVRLQNMHKMTPPRSANYLSYLRLCLSLGIISIYISQHNFPDDNSVWNHSCFVRYQTEHGLLSISWHLLSVELQITECEICRYESNEGFSGRLESKLLTVLPPFPVPRSWTSDCRLKTWRLDTTACLSIHNIIPPFLRMFFHVARSSDDIYVHSFSIAPVEIRTFCCSRQRDFCSAYINVECMLSTLDRWTT